MGGLLKPRLNAADMGENATTAVSLHPGDRVTRQLALPLPMSTVFRAGDFLPDESNAAARAWLADPTRWPAGRLALHGPAGTGKTHLLSIHAAARGWRLMEGSLLRGIPSPGPTALDNADLVPEEAALFHLLNACAEAGQPLLLAGREAPARWGVALPDLASRLRATTSVALGEPSDALLAALLARHFTNRGLLVDAGLQDWLLARLPREAQAVAEAAARLDRAALAAGRRVTRGLARDALRGWAGFGEDGESDDGFRAMAATPSPLGSVLL